MRIYPKTKEAYREFLKSPFWIELRKQKLQESGHVCNRCGSRSRLQCHHVRYRDSWEGTLLSDLEVLCETCHKIHHGIIKKKPVSDESSIRTLEWKIESLKVQYKTQGILTGPALKKLENELYCLKNGIKRRQPKPKRQNRKHRRKSKSLSKYQIVKYENWMKRVN